MKKTAYYLLSLFASLLLGGLSYLLSESLIFAIAVFGVATTSFASFVVPILLKKKENVRKRKECYRFVSSFIISLSLTGSLEKSFDGATADVGGEFKEVIHAADEFDVPGKIKYLNSYFESEPYSMFLSLYGLYEEQGGKLLDLARELLDELTRIEESANKMEVDSELSLKEFIVTWILSLGIMGFLRVGLANFYESLVKNILYIGALAAFFLFFIFSCSFYFYVYAGKPKLGFLSSKKKGEKK